MSQTQFQAPQTWGHVAKQIWGARGMIWGPRVNTVAGKALPSRPGNRSLRDKMPLAMNPSSLLHWGQVGRGQDSAQGQVPTPRHTRSAGFPPGNLFPVSFHCAFTSPAPPGSSAGVLCSGPHPLP